MTAFQTEIDNVNATVLSGRPDSVRPAKAVHERRGLAFATRARWRTASREIAITHVAYLYRDTCTAIPVPWWRATLSGNKRNRVVARIASVWLLSRGHVPFFHYNRQQHRPRYIFIFFFLVFFAWKAVSARTRNLRFRDGPLLNDVRLEKGIWIQTNFENRIYEICSFRFHETVSRSSITATARAQRFPLNGYKIRLTN